MTNLKKVLSLVLVLVMAFGLAISASAATLSDWDDVKNQEDVQLLSSLQIMQGRADGSFDPDGYLTRAEVAKIIYVGRTGGVDDKAILFKGASNLFSDISGHWAEGYINFAAAKKLVSGRGNGKYDPNATITGYELLKIALTALGYDATAEGFVGADWKLNVAAAAMDAGLITGYTADPNLPITRDDAANIIANLVYANTISYNILTNKAVVNASSFGEDYLGLVKVTGVLKANEYAGLGIAPNAVKTSWIDADADGVVDAGETIPVTTDANLLGYNVTALVSKNAAGATVKVYGLDKTVGKNADLTVIPVVSDPIDTAPVYFLDYAASNLAGMAGATDIKYIDNNGNGKYDVILGTAYTFDKVLGVTKNATTGVITVDFNTSADLTSATYNGLDTLAKDDRVLIMADNASTAKGLVSKVAPTAGTLTAFSTTNVYVDGVKYGKSAITNNVLGTVVVGNVGKTGSFYLYNGSVVEYAPTTPAASTTKYAYVYAASHTADVWSGANTYSVKVLLDDGTNQVYVVAKVGGVAPAADVASGLYSYVVNTAGKLELTAAGVADAGGSGAYTKGSNKFDSLYVTADTISFVQVSVAGVPTWVVYKGFDLPSVNAIAPAAGSNYKVTGDLVVANDMIKVLVVPSATLTVPADTITKYLVMAEPIVSGATAGGDEIYTVKAFNGTEVKEFTYVSAAADIAVVKGGRYTFTPVDGKLTAPVAYASADVNDSDATIAATGVATYCANNIFGYAAYVAAVADDPTTPAVDESVPAHYATAISKDYDANTKFYKVNYAAGTVDIITSADVNVKTAAEVTAVAAKNIAYTMGTNAAGAAVVTAVWYIVG